MEKFYLRFFPGFIQNAKKFAQSLPDKKISMAKLQNHFMKFRDNPQDCLDNARQVLQANDEVAEMTVSEWLYRQNC